MPVCRLRAGPGRRQFCGFPSPTRHPSSLACVFGLSGHRVCGYLFLIRSPGNFLIFCMGLSFAVSPVVVSSCIGPCRVWGLVGLAGSRCWGLVLRLARSRFRVGGPLGFPGQVPFFRFRPFSFLVLFLLWVAVWVLESCFHFCFFTFCFLA